MLFPHDHYIPGQNTIHNTHHQLSQQKKYKKNCHYQMEEV